MLRAPNVLFQPTPRQLAALRSRLLSSTMLAARSFLKHSARALLARLGAPLRQVIHAPPSKVAPRAVMLGPVARGRLFRVASIGRSRFLVRRLRELPSMRDAPLMTRVRRRASRVRRPHLRLRVRRVFTPRPLVASTTRRSTLLPQSTPLRRLPRRPVVQQSELRAKNAWRSAVCRRPKLRRMP